jgi:cobalamin biosynthesis protein CobW
MTALLDRADRLDHIVIETSGLALPQPLVRAFNWPEIRTRVTVDGVVTVVDAHAVAAGRFADDEDALDRQRQADDSLDHDSPLEELFEDQLACADLIILNKADLLDDAALEKVHGDVVARIPRAVKVVRATGGDLGVDVLLGLGIGAEDDIGARKSRHEMEEGEDHDHDEFESFPVRLGEIGDIDGLRRMLGAVIANHDILRLKGFAAVSGKPMRLVVQAVGRRVDTYFDRDWEPGEARATGLVVIGQAGLDRAAIARALGA